MSLDKVHSGSLESLPIDEHGMIYGPAENSIAMLQSSLSKLSEAISESYNCFDYSTFYDSLRRMLEQMVLACDAIKETLIVGLEKSFERLNALCVELAFDLSKVSIDAISDSLMRTISSALTLAAPYVSETCQKECAESVAAISEKRSRRHLTIGDVLALLALLVSVYSAIIASLPDKQIDRIIAQNDVIIGQNEELIALNREDLELQNALNALTDSINLMTEEVDLLREELKSSKDCSVPERQGDANNSHQQDSNTQD